jgi:hypothetical protein
MTPLPKTLHVIYKGTSPYQVSCVINTLKQQERVGIGNPLPLAMISWIIATCHKTEYEFTVTTITREEYQGPYQLRDEDNFLHVIWVAFSNPVMEQRFKEVFAPKYDDDDGF